MSYTVTDDQKEKTLQCYFPVSLSIWNDDDFGMFRASCSQIINLALISSISASCIENGKQDASQMFLVSLSVDVSPSHCIAMPSGSGTMN